MIKRIRARYEKAKALGLLEYAYIYGCDEHPKEKFLAWSVRLRTSRRSSPMSW